MGNGGNAIIINTVIDTYIREEFSSRTSIPACDSPRKAAMWKFKVLSGVLKRFFSVPTIVAYRDCPIGFFFSTIASRMSFFWIRFFARARNASQETPILFVVADETLISIFVD